MSFEQWINDISEEAAPEQCETPQHMKPRCNECRDAEVAQDGDLCETCQAELSRGYVATVMLGRIANDFQHDRGRLSHARKRDGRWWSHTAVCGATPGRRSVGWSSYHDADVTCPRCLKRLAKEAGA